MSPIATLLWFSNLFIDTFGQLSFKAAANGPSPDGIVERWKMLLSNYWLWLGIGTYVIEFFVYLAFLSYVPLAQGLLVGSLNIVAVMLGGRLIFKEELTPNRLLAIALIATGVALVGWGPEFGSKAMTQFYLIGFFVLMVFDTMAQIGFKMAAQHSTVPGVFDLGVIFSWICQVMSKHFIYFSLAGYLGAFITWMTLLKHAPIGPAFAASHLEIVSVMIISVIFLDEKLNVIQVVGSLLILGGIFVLATEAGTEGKKQIVEDELLLTANSTGGNLTVKTREPVGRTGN